MSDKFVQISMKELASWVFNELENKQSIFGIPSELFFKPADRDVFKQEIYGLKLETPFGVAAGPHSQMAQNIIAAWLCGARFIELKTVQTLDELEVSKPCIDMLDVGYNCEWSQELKLQQSFDEYLRAWVLIHVLHSKLGFPGKTPGVIFNLSVGYNLEGILKENVQQFLKNMKNAGSLLDEYIELVSEFYPEVKDLDIPARLSDNVTLSTMHGCPPDEIGKIASYLIEECGYHTNVKLNPTLLGPEQLRGILNKDLGFREITVPDIAFEHDLKYKDAVPMLNMLQKKADRKGVTFGVKLSNTLEVINHRNVFGKEEQMMYLSGRPLQAVTVNLAKKLAVEFDGRLLMSYAGGADCFNVKDLIRSGMKTVTVSSDILRPGGYTRMLQYIDYLAAAIKEDSCSDISQYICKEAEKIGCSGCAVESSAFENLKQYAEFVLSDSKYIRDTYLRKNTKTDRKLELFDCIKAPCTDTCPIDQNVPKYIKQVTENDIGGAAETILKDNAVATILGRACNHDCEVKCSRTHYDEPVAIRELKRFIIDNAQKNIIAASNKKLNVKIAVVGAGPGGLSAAYFLVNNGCNVTIFEERSKAAGMVSKTIPAYRATNEAVMRDIDYLEKIGVKVQYGCKVGRDISIDELKNNNDYVIIAVGAQKGVLPGISGENTTGVMDGIDFLHKVKSGDKIELGKKIAVIGAGDVAMDCARVANRITEGEVSVVYRRTVEEMPAHKEELDGLIEEGIEIKELCAPKAVIEKDGKISALKCVMMKLGEPDESGRKRPVEIENSDFDIKLDSLILAIGQKPDFDFLKGLSLNYNRKGYIEVNPETMKTVQSTVYAVGDAVENGPQTIVKAAGDGKKAALNILAESSLNIKSEETANTPLNKKEYIIKRAKREFRVKIPELPVNKRKGFDEIVQTLDKTAAEKEASRCLKCDQYCGTCVSVCPNKALFTYEVEPEKINVPVINGESEIFKITQKYQTAVFTSFCNECGNCMTFCPTSGKPYADKVRLYNNAVEFEGQDNNAFMIFNDNGKYSIRAKFDGELFILDLVGDNLLCTNYELKAIISSKDFSINKVEIIKAVNDKKYSLRKFIVMYTILKGITESVKELPLNQ